MVGQLRQAMIIIAVSKYGGGAYDDLPGTLYSSRRLRNWAVAPSADRNYDVLTIDDSALPVTAKRVEEEITDFLSTRAIDRLVVYFGGHGAQQQVGQVWLLSEADKDNRGEAIDFANFKEGLRKANIGGLNRNIESGQVWIISDACRNPDIGFIGRPILTRGRRTKNVEFDIYHSCLSEDYSFHLDPTPQRNYPHLLFTEALVDVLESAIPETIETTYHPLKPAMLNHLVAKFLRKEVPLRGVSSRLDQDTTPDIQYGFSHPHNFYVAPMDPDTPVKSQPPPASSSGEPIVARRMGRFSPQSTSERITEIRKLRAELGRHTLTINSARDTGNNPWVFSDVVPAAIAIPAGLENNLAIRKFGSGAGIFADGWPVGAPILVQQGDMWISCPSFPNSTSVLLGKSLPGDLLLLRNEDPFVPPEHRNLATASWDSSWSDLFIQMGDQPLRMSDANLYADSMRSNKYEYPHHAVTAAYLYEKSGDYENILRTAHYMARNGRWGVPFDLALLSASKIEWELDGETWIAKADFPEVAERPDGHDESASGVQREYYTRRGFRPRKGVPLLSFVPTHGRGWSLLKYIEEFHIPESLRRIANEAFSRTTSVLSDDGANAFMQAFGYRVMRFSDIADAPFYAPKTVDPVIVESMPAFLQVTPLENAYLHIESRIGKAPTSKEFQTELDKLGADFLKLQFKNDTTGDAS